jgi:hypothetical protein
MLSTEAASRRGVALQALETLQHAVTLRGRDAGSGVDHGELDRGTCAPTRTRAC